MRKILFVLLLVLAFVGCKPTPSPTDPSEHSEIPIRHKTGKIVSVYEVISGSDEAYNTQASVILKDFAEYRRDSFFLFLPMVDSQGNIYSCKDLYPEAKRIDFFGGYCIYKNYTPLTQYNRHPEISGENSVVYDMFLVYDKLFVIALYDSRLSFCVDGEWYPIETDEGPIDSIASTPWVDNDTIYFLKRMSAITWDKINYDIVKIPVINGRPQKGVMAHKEFVIIESEQAPLWRGVKRLIVQNDNVLVFVNEIKHASPTYWYDASNWSLYVNGGRVCDNQINGYFGGMGVVGNDVYYCVQNLRSHTATIYKNNEVYQNLQDVWSVMRAVSCGDDMYMIIFKEDANGTKYKEVWHNGQFESRPYIYLGAVPNQKEYRYYMVPQISYETYVEE